jgi:hypothetical protein
MMQIRFNKISLFYLLFLIVISGCIEAVDISTTEEKKLLVVQGFISTLPGPHEFKLSKSAKYGSIFEGFSKKEENASIFIKDNTGEQVFLEEKFPGTYVTPVGYRAEVGKTYSLIINSKAGTYISTPETVVPVPKLEKVSAEFRALPSPDTFNFQSGVKFFSHFQDPPDEQNFLLWINESTYEFYTRPDLFRIPAPGGGIPSPKACCKLCWRTEFISNANLFLYDDNRSNGNEIQTEAYYVSDDGLRFREKYQMRLQQHSLSRGAYQYYKLLKEQLEISGDIFDPPPASLSGNIINVDDPNVNVIGYFHATDVSIDSVFVEKSLITKKQNPRQLNDDCRQIGNSTANEPLYWY